VKVGRPLPLYPLQGESLQGEPLSLNKERGFRGYGRIFGIISKFNCIPKGGSHMNKSEGQGQFNENDDELILKAQDGDLHSFDLLVRRYQKKIYFLAYRMVKSHDAADDMAQETFINAYLAIKSFKTGHSFYTWLYRICMNLSINFLKRQKLVIPESQFEEESRPLEKEATRLDSSNHLALKELETKIEKALDRLPPKYKAVLILRIYEDLSYEEIAKTLKISTGTVMSRLFRAREKMQEMLKEYKDSC
jgi:RNA polymerase sigma-70 factor (ECF subfamily)